MNDKLSEVLKQKLTEEQLLEELDNKIYKEEKTLLEEMAEIDRQDNIIIKVFGKEGFIPHFHIYTTDGRQTCLQFKKNAYFLHGKYQDTLTNKELKIVMNIMNKVNEDYKNLTNWEFTILNWNRSNTQKEKQLPSDLKIPNYYNPKIEK